MIVPKYNSANHFVALFRLTRATLGGHHLPAALLLPERPSSDYPASPCLKWRQLHICARGERPQSSQARNAASERRLKGRVWTKDL